jgi:hypothetical protein
VEPPEEQSPGAAAGGSGGGTATDLDAVPRCPAIDWLAVPLAIGVLVVLTVPRLPPGICFHDPGELQVTAATLGIAHPPGYAGYASLGHLLTYIPGVSPAYAVTLGCLGAGLAALALCALAQVRLGVNAWLAAALIAVLAAHPRVWINLVVPEVYAPSLAFEAGAAYLLLRYIRPEQAAKRRDLLLAALLLGVALANRPPVALALVGFVAALGVVWWRRRTPLRQVVRDALLAAACLAVPCVYTAGYLWVRDAESTVHNYIEGYNAVAGTLPDMDAGPAAKAERIAWLVTGQQFKAERSWSFAEIPGRLRWLVEQVALGRDAVFVLVVTAAVWGATVTNRRSSASMLLLIGMALAATTFVCTYRVHDTAADMLPILWVLTVFAGVATEFDATPFVRTADLPTLPTNALVLAAWREACPLQYARWVETARSDIEAATLTPNRWLPRARRHVARPDGRAGPVYLAKPITVPDDVTLTPYRNLWRLDFSSDQQDTQR